MKVNCAGGEPRRAKNEKCERAGLGGEKEKGVGKTDKKETD